MDQPKSNLVEKNSKWKDIVAEEVVTLKYFGTVVDLEKEDGTIYGIH